MTGSGSILLRRMLVLAAFAFWQGGFTFYASVVVPIGQQVLGSHLDQGLITRRVTPYLNLAGAVALVLFAVDAAVAGTRKSPWRCRLRWLCWAGMAVALGLLVWLHPRVDALLDADAGRLVDRRVFRTLHRTYLWISSVQWGLALVYAALTLSIWRREDRFRNEADG